MPKDAGVEVDLASQSGEEIIVGPDYFVERDGVRYAGGHLFLDFWGARDLTDPGKIEHALTMAAHGSSDGAAPGSG